MLQQRHDGMRPVLTTSAVVATELGGPDVRLAPTRYGYGNRLGSTGRSNTCLVERP